MRRFVAAGLAVLVTVVAGAPMASASPPVPIVVVGIQKAPASVTTLPAFTDCSTFLQDMTKAPKSFKLVSMHTSVFAAFPVAYVAVTYTLEKLAGAVASAVLVQCAAVPT